MLIRFIDQRYWSVWLDRENRGERFENGKSKKFINKFEAIKWSWRCAPGIMWKNMAGMYNIKQCERPLCVSEFLLWPDRCR